MSTGEMRYAADYRNRATGKNDIMAPPGMHTRVTYTIMRYGLGLNAEGVQWWGLPGLFETPEQVMEEIKSHLELMSQFPSLQVTEDEYVVLKSTTTVELWSEADE